MATVHPMQRLAPPTIGSGTFTEVDVDSTGRVIRGGTSPTPKLKDIIPVGVALPWFGRLADLPEGFQICDGTHGTPDLRDKFILGTGTGEEPGGVGVMP